MGQTVLLKGRFVVCTGRLGKSKAGRPGREFTRVKTIAAVSRGSASGLELQAEREMQSRIVRYKLHSLLVLKDRPITVTLLDERVCLFDELAGQGYL